MKTIVIGIAGGTGSGKTTLAHRLVEAFGRDEICMLNHDAYYKRHDDLPFEERCKLNYDHPDSFDTDLMVEHLQQLKAGQGVDMPVYDYTRHTRSDETVRVNPAPVILVEGILIFASPELCHEMDSAPHSAGCAGSRPHTGQRGGAVSHHCKAHARAVCGTQQAQGRPDHSRGRQK